MRLTTTLMATLACSQAIRIEATVDSQANVEFLSNIGDWASDAVNNIGDFAEDFGDVFNDGLD